MFNFASFIPFQICYLYCHYLCLIGKTIRFSSQQKHKALALHRSSKRKKTLSNSSNLALALLSALQREAWISFSGVTSLFLSLFLVLFPTVRLRSIPGKEEIFSMSTQTDILKGHSPFG